jgi:hypothetical protein
MCIMQGFLLGIPIGIYFGEKQIKFPIRIEKRGA